MTLAGLIEILRSAEKPAEIDKYRDEIAGLIPDISIMFDYDQNNPYHCYDLWMHSLYTVTGLPRGNADDMLYLAALIHDIGKPDTRCRSKRPDDPYAHYYRHAAKSAEIAEARIIPQLNKNADEDADAYVLSADDARRLIYYVKHHDDEPASGEKFMQRQLNEASPEEVRNLLMLQIADAEAHVQLPAIVERIKSCRILLAAAY